MVFVIFDPNLFSPDCIDAVPKTLVRDVLFFVKKIQRKWSNGG